MMKTVIKDLDWKKSAFYREYVQNKNSLTGIFDNDS